jgi:sugar/nucleoside kinase (ribokinase family)
MTIRYSHRVGIASAGNWIVDQVKMLDCLPARGMLANIASQEPSTGGAPANVLADLARLKAPFPLTGVGIVGDDDGGRYILDRFRKLGVDCSHLTVTKQAATSYTDVMTDMKTGDRAFFHCRGANALFGPEHIPFETLNCRILHLGYLLLLDRMDEEDAEYGTVAARVLRDAQARGIKTSVDVVSEDGDRFNKLVPPALPYVDYLILNEIEAARTVGLVIRQNDGRFDGPALVDTIHRLAAMCRGAFIAIHMPEGVLIRDVDGKLSARGSLTLPAGFIQSAVGAGDAFCAGLLFGLHEEWPHERSAMLGACCAAASLSARGATDGVGTLDEVFALGSIYPEREPPVGV